jgi:hypothetical protein
MTTAVLRKRIGSSINNECVKDEVSLDEIISQPAEYDLTLGLNLQQGIFCAIPNDGIDDMIVHYETDGASLAKDPTQALPGSELKLEKCEASAVAISPLWPGTSSRQASRFEAESSLSGFRSATPERVSTSEQWPNEKLNDNSRNII